MVFLLDWEFGGTDLRAASHSASGPRGYVPAKQSWLRDVRKAVGLHILV